MRDLLRGELDVEHTRAARLTCLTGTDAGNVVPIAFEQMTLGRGDECTLQVRDRAVSRKHAKLSQRAGRVFIEDLRGANGTYVNGQRVLLRVALEPGDVIELGQTLLRYDAPAHVQPPPPPPQTPVPEPVPALAAAIELAAAPDRWTMLPVACGAAAAVIGLALALVALV
jgi:predicted component of type VI protein secretion system